MHRCFRILAFLASLSPALAQDAAPPPDPSLDAIRSRVESPDESVRAQVTKALLAAKIPPKDAAPFELALLADRSASVRQSVADRFFMSDQFSAEVWLAALRSDDPKIAATALRSIGDKTPLDPEMLPIIGDRLRKNDYNAVMPLVAFGKSAGPEIRKSWESGDDSVRGLVLSVCGNVMKDCEEGMSVALDALEGKNLQHAQLAAILLGASDTEVAMRALAEAVATKEPDLRASIISGLPYAVVHHEIAAAIIVSALHLGPARAAARAAEALLAIGAEGPEAIRSAFAEPERTMPRAHVDAIMAMLLARLDSDKPSDRQQALTLLTVSPANRLEGLTAALQKRADAATGEAKDEILATLESLEAAATK